MLKVELIYDSDCPNAAATRENLVRAFARVGLPAKWREWERSHPDTPDRARRFGSPSIVINGRDLDGHEGENAPLCRLYRTAAGSLSGVPSVESIVKRLADGISVLGRTHTNGMKAHLPVAVAISLSLLPNLACAACWPAYAGFLSACGLGFLMRTGYLVSVTALFLVLALGGLWYRAEVRRGYWPLCLGAIAIAAILAGKFWLEFSPLSYAGLIMLVGASVWNTWPAKTNSEWPELT
jgi:mercuric ion transport protein